MQFRGSSSKSTISEYAEVNLRYDPHRLAIILTLSNASASRRVLKVSSGYANNNGRLHTLTAGESIQDVWFLASSGGWFDLSVIDANNAQFLRRFAGHLEDGRPSISDPANFHERHAI